MSQSQFNFISSCVQATNQQSVSIIPSDLLSGLCVWRYEDRKGKLVKPPRDPRTDFLLRPNQPHSWLSLNTLLSAASITDHGIMSAQGVEYAGLGRVSQYAVDSIIAIDIDHCVDGAGTIADWASPYLALADSYGEISPSGSGLRLFVRGVLPESLAGCSYRKIKTKGSIPESPDSEVQISMSRNFMTLTGQRISAATEVATNQEYIDWLISQISAPKSPKKSKTPQHNTVNFSGCHTSQAEIDGAIEFLSRPDVSNYFGNEWVGIGTRKDKSPSGYMATVIESAARVGFGEEIAVGIWQRWCNLNGVEFNPAKWSRSWSKLGIHLNHNSELLWVSHPIKPADSISLDFPAGYSLTQRLQAIYYRSFSIGLSEDEALWFAVNELKRSGEDRLVMPHDVRHWARQARALLDVHRRGRKSKQTPSGQVIKVGKLMGEGRKAQEIAEITGVDYATVRKQMSRARKYGLVIAPAAVEQTWEFDSIPADTLEIETDSDLVRLFDLRSTFADEWEPQMPGCDLDDLDFPAWRDMVRSMHDFERAAYREYIESQAEIAELSARIEAKREWIISSGSRDEKLVPADFSGMSISEVKGFIQVLKTIGKIERDRPWLSPAAIAA